MKIKRYEVYNMKEAISIIKKDLGPEAVILTTRKIVKNNMFGLFSRPLLEVTAAVDYSRETSKNKDLNKDNYKSNYKKEDKLYKDNQVDIDKFTEVLKTLGLTKFENLINDIQSIKYQLAEMKNFMSKQSVVDLNPHIEEFYRLLIRNGLDEVIAYKLLKKLENRVENDIGRLKLKNIIMHLLAEITPISKDSFEDIRGGALIIGGPTGVGKTTTVAKLAAILAAKKQKKVGVISLDTFRIGAIEQLKIYAEIIEVPFFVVNTPEQLRDILNKCNDYDYLLIDSIGRSQYENSQIRELRRYMDVAPNIKIALVLSMSGNHEELYDTFDRYNNLKPDYLIFTKLDETKYFGPLVNMPIIKKAPLLFLTDGQNVPEDLEIPNGKKIAKYILNDIPKVWDL
ncbi:MAG: flagellar biosynthesis protein FlhF [Deferribacterota bacterium]|nr:flagellar biosynthesis protein FlhF [Deferribacterota bacterium]